jgi:hypothetical protein
MDAVARNHTRSRYDRARVDLRSFSSMSPSGLIAGAACRLACLSLMPAGDNERKTITAAAFSPYLPPSPIGLLHF